MTTEDLPTIKDDEIRVVHTSTGCIIHVTPDHKVVAAWRPVRPGEWFAVRNPISEEEFQLIAGKEGWELWRDDDGLHNGNVDSRVPEDYGLFMPLRDSAISQHGIKQTADDRWYARLDMNRKPQVMNPEESIPTPTIAELSEQTDALARACTSPRDDGAGHSIYLMANYHFEKTRTRQDHNLPGLVNAGFETGLSTKGGAEGQCLNPDAIPTPRDAWAASMISITQAGLAHEARGPVSKFLVEELVKHDNFSISLADVEVITDIIGSMLLDRTDVAERHIHKLTTDATVAIITYLQKNKVKPIVILTPPTGLTEEQIAAEDTGTFDLQASSPFPPEEKA